MFSLRPLLMIQGRCRCTRSQIYFPNIMVSEWQLEYNPRSKPNSELSSFWICHLALLIFHSPHESITTLLFIRCKLSNWFDFRTNIRSNHMLSPSLPVIWEKSEDKILMQIYMRAVNYLQLKEETCMNACLHYHHKFSKNQQHSMGRIRTLLSIRK